MWPQLKAGTGPTYRRRVLSLASSPRSFTNFKCPSHALHFCPSYSISYKYVHLSSRFVTAVQLKIIIGKIPSKFQRAFRHTSAECDYRYSTIHRWRWGVNNTSRPLYPLERVPAPIVQEAGWAPGSVCMA